MSGTSLSINIKSDLPKLQRPLRQLLKLGLNPKPLLEQIAWEGEVQTRERFSTETGPDGKKWEESLRKKLFGGKTLTRDGHLGDSISSAATDTQAKWGSNRIYAAIHQFGGVIKAKTSKGLAFQLADGKDVVVSQVTMPARPFLGLSDENKQDIQATVRRYLREAMAAQGGA